MGRARASQTAVRAVRRRNLDRASPLRWTDETLRVELETFVRGRRKWPTADEFVAAGREDLRNAVKRHGGAVWWARRLGVPLGSGQDRAPYSEADALTEAREVVARLGFLPGKRRVRELGYGRLATYLVTNGGAAAFAEKHKLPQSARLSQARS